MTKNPGYRVDEFKVEYVRHMPIIIQQGIIYISLEFTVSIHLCACGCLGKTVMPFEKKEGGWKLSVLANDPNIVTFRPSVGNWAGEQPGYHAHYYISNNKVEWL